jgi:histidine ammonia-lyase
MNSVFRYGEDQLTPGIAIRIANGQTKGIIDEKAKAKIQKTFNNVKHILSQDKPVYGVNTGFGVLCRSIISKEDAAALQYNLLKSHACGVGEPVKPFIAKLMMIIKVNSLAIGYSGTAYETLNRIIWHIENDIIPAVPIKGSVGASGDLAPLAHLFLPLIGLGRVFYKGKIVDTQSLFKELNIKPLKLHPKEGLALINGTQFMSAFGIYGLDRFYNCLEHADIISSITIEALKGSVKPFDETLHSLRPYAGSIYVAERIRNFLNGSEILRSHINCSKVQDPYSLRCIPQVHGAARNAFLHFKEILTTEINSVTDNPVIIDKDNVVSGGNFHGELIAMPADYAALAASEVGNISDRRSYLLLSGDEKELPKMLMDNVGINSGFMISQYVSAALASENKTLVFPASADSIPTSLGQEDHVSMGSISMRKFNTILDNLEYILSIEMLLAAQGLEFRKPLKSSKVLEQCHALIREKIDFAKEDRIFSEDIEKSKSILKSRVLLDIVNNALNIKQEDAEMFSLF